MTTIREATAADGPSLIAFLGETPVRAGTEFVLDRGPDFGALLRLRGLSRTFIALQEHRVVGAVTALWHEGMDGDAGLRLGEIVDLRVTPELRGTRLASRLLERAAAALAQAGADWVLCLIGDRNREAVRLVSGRAGFPALRELSRYASVHFPVWRAPQGRPRAPFTVRPATSGDAPALAALSCATVVGRRFAPPTLFPWPDPDGTHHAWIAEDKRGRPIGGLVVWDPLSVRRIRVRRYSSADQMLRVLMWLGSLLGVAGPLPQPGDTLRLWASRWLGAVDHPSQVTDALVRAAMRAAATADQHVLQINLEVRDPLLPMMPGFPRSSYWSTLYGCPLRDDVPNPVESSICHADLALV